MSFAALQPLADRAALFTALRQDALVTATDALGEHRWDADLNAGTLTFTANDDATKQFVTKPHLIATLAPGPRSLLWAWAHPQGDAQGVAAQLRDYGQQYGIAELTQAELPFPDDAGEDAEGWIAQATHVIGSVAVEITGRSPYSPRRSAAARAPSSCWMRRSLRSPCRMPSSPHPACSRL